MLIGAARVAQADGSQLLDLQWDARPHAPGWQSGGGDAGSAAPACRPGTSGSGPPDPDREHDKPVRCRAHAIMVLRTALTGPTGLATPVTDIVTLPSRAFVDPDPYGQFTDQPHGGPARDCKHPAPTGTTIDPSRPLV